MTIRRFVVPVVFSLATAAAHAAPQPNNGPPFAGLPNEIPMDFLAREGFLRIQELTEEESRALRNGRNYAPAPIATNFQFDGVTVHVADRAKQDLVFDESMWAMIPHQSVIGVQRDNAGREFWDYPIGASAVHLIRYHDARHSIFELRLARRVSPERWAFGSYSPAPDGSRLLLNTYTGWPSIEHNVPLTEGPWAGRTVNVKMSRIKLDTCQGCHFSNSTADYQYERRRDDGRVDYWASVAVTGPCGFVPTNHHVRGAWADEWTSLHNGHSPFVEVDPRGPASNEAPAAPANAAPKSRAPQNRGRRTGASSVR